MRKLAAIAILGALAFTPAAADDDRPPRPGAKPLSQIIAQIEARPDFMHITDVEWDDGRYEIEYRTRSGREREIRVDPHRPPSK